MPEQVRRIDYYYVAVPDKPGEAARILSALHQAGVSLIGGSSGTGVGASSNDLSANLTSTTLKTALGLDADGKLYRGNLLQQGFGE